MPAEHAGDPAAQNVEDIARAEQQVSEALPFGERVAKRVTDAVGTPAAAWVHLVVFAAWVIWNSGAIPGVYRFDPYPFGFLTMFVSYEAAIISIFVLITQNRMIKASERRERLDLQVDMLAEQEMTMVLRMLHRISEQLGIEPDTARDESAQKLMERTNVYELLRKIDQKFGKP